MRTVYVHGRAVLPDRVLDDALVVAEDGVLTEVGPARPGAVPAEAVDLRGALVLPGLVDTHSDGLEKEISPRPGVEFDLDFAITSFEGRVRAAGVTTCFHGIGYERNVRKERDVQRARRIEQGLLARAVSGRALLDHRPLYRLDARDPDALEGLRTSIAERTVAGGARGSNAPALVSYEDHTPGQGQYRDQTYFRNYLAGTEGLSTEEANRRTRETKAERDRNFWHREVSLAWLQEQAHAGTIRLLTHDPVTVEEIDAHADGGVAVAEFPTTVEAARAARYRGLHVVAGAPNILRGGSHSGNVSALELVRLGLVGGLSSDYLPSTLLAAAVRLAETGVLDLPSAVRLVTAGPAGAAGLEDRGLLAPGMRADLVVATVEGGWPTVRGGRTAEDGRDGHTCATSASAGPAIRTAP